MMNSKVKSLIVVFALAAVSLLPAIAKGEVIDIADPVMKVFLPEKSGATGKCVVILPGGGYSGLAVDHEGYDWAPFFNERGIACAVVSYRMPHGDRSLPISDAEKAMKIVRDNATEWKINPDDVGIMGFSAGGHLASTIATHSADGLRPDFQILFYPVITMDAAFTHQGSRNNLLGDSPSSDLVDEFSNEKQVSGKTPKAFVVLSGDDDIVAVANSLRYYESLIKENIPVSMHIYPSGGHGWGYNSGFKYHPQVIYELDNWLKE